MLLRLCVKREQVFDDGSENENQSKSSELVGRSTYEESRFGVPIHLSLPDFPQGETIRWFL